MGKLHVKLRDSAAESGQCGFGELLREDPGRTPEGPETVPFELSNGASGANYAKALRAAPS